MRIYASQRRFFEKAYATGEKGWGTVEPEPIFVEYVKRMPMKRGQRAIDLGCGEGRHAQLLAQYGWSVFGVDYCCQALLSAKKLASRTGLDRKLHWVEGDVLALPFKAGSFGLALDYGCFHHVCQRDWQHYFTELERILLSKGFFLLACFSEHYKHAPADLCKRNYLVHKGHYDHFFTRSDLKKLLQSRFSVLELKEQREGGDAFWFALLQRRG